MNLIDFFVNHNIILTAILAFGLGVWVYLDSRKDVRNVTLGAVLIAVSLWSFSLVLWRQATEIWQAEFWIRSSFLIVTFLPVLFLFFAYAIHKDRLPPLWFQVAAILPSLVFGWAIFATSSVICDLTEISSVCFGGGKMILAMHFATFVVISLCLLLFPSANKRNRIDRNRMAMLLVGTLVAFNVVFAAMFVSEFSLNSVSVWVGNVALLVGMFIVAASVSKRQLLVDLRLVSVEIFIFIALAMVVADMVMAQGMVDFTMRLVILILLVVYGIFTIRYMVKDVKRIRKMSQMMEQLTEINGRLLETDKVKTQLVSFASHQLRAPVSGIKNYLSMLSNGDFGVLKEKQQEIIGINIAALNQMSKTIEMFLNVAKDELGKLELYKSETDIVGLANQVIDVLGPSSEKKGVKLTLEVQGSLPPVECDHGKIYHAFLNLVDNAIKYTQSGTVKIRMEKVGRNVHVEVIDTGIGLNKAERDGIFQTFRRGLSAIRLNSDGSGLGIYIVQKIIEAHGGKFTVNSSGVGKGSTFGFILPIS